MKAKDVAELDHDLCVIEGVIGTYLRAADMVKAGMADKGREPRYAPKELMEHWRRITAATRHYEHAEKKRLGMYQ